MCTILDCNIAEFGALPVSESLVKTLISEFAAVAEKAIHLDQAEVYTHIAQTYDPNGIGLHYPSMYQDLIKIIVSQKLITLMVLFGAKDKIQRSNTFVPC